MASDRREASPVSRSEPRRLWRAVLLATLLLVPAYLALLVGVVTVTAEAEGGVPNPGAYIAFGLCLIPFVLIALAFMSQHPRAAAASVRGMVLTVAVAIPVSALAADVVTGFVAGVGAGGIVTLRADVDRPWKARILAIVLATVWAFLTVRTVPVVAALLAPALPFSSLLVADHLLELWRGRGG